jgi:iron(III) transport system substrate-binding protein
MCVSRVILILAFAAVLVVPYAFRPATEAARGDALSLVIITPHPQTVWYEFEHAFSAWHERHYGRPVRIDWRQPGGVGLIHEFLNARYDAVDALRGRAGRGIGTGIGIDLLFGGGQYDHEVQKKAGHLEPCGIRSGHPELLLPRVIPQALSGEVLYDKDDCYYGTCLAAYGIVSNTEAMMQQGYPRDLIPPKHWEDLTSPLFFRKIVMADPAMSGAITKAFELVIQQAIDETIRERRARGEGDAALPKSEPSRSSQDTSEPGDAPETEKELRPLARAGAERAAVADGFWRGMRRIQLIGANARRVARANSEAVVDVAQGESLAGMCIDYYGLVQAAAVARPDGGSRVMYVSPVGGSTPDADCIALLRGAPHAELARRFVHFCLTPEGQQLWCYRVGAPGGPIKYALHRPPIRRDMYVEDRLAFFADRDMRPYALAESFTYHPEWTAPLFNFIRVFTRAMCLDPDEELRDAWRAILDAGMAYPESPAMQALQRMPLTYDELFGEALRKRLRDPVGVVDLTREWSAFFRANYAEAARIARSSRRGR